MPELVTNETGYKVQVKSSLIISNNIVNMFAVTETLSALANCSRLKCAPKKGN